MRLLALDPATSCGWAIGKAKYRSPTESGTWILRDSDDTKCRLAILWRELESLRRRVRGRIDIVAYETPVFGRSRNGGDVLQKMAGVIELFARLNDCDIHTYSPSAIKKFATGSGNSSKAEMMAEATRRGRIYGTDDECDAQWIWDLARTRIMEKRKSR